MLFNRSLCHGKLVVSALKMIVGKYRPSHYRKIGVGSDKVVRELLYKIKEFTKCIVLYLHRNMLRIEHDTVLVIIHIGAVLKPPRTLIYLHRNDTVILSCRMIHPSRIPFILAAKKAFRVA